MIVKSSTCLSPKIIIHDTSSLKSTKPTEFRKFHNAGSALTISSSEQDHNACSGSSAVALNHSHIGSVMIVLHTRACFVDMALRQALHMNVFTFCCTCINQIPFQTCLSRSGGTCAIPASSASSLRNLYPNLQL